MATTSTASSIEVAKNLFLVRQSVGTTAKARPVETPTNHLLVLDVSGSMSCELPKIRAQLKLKLPKLVRDDDTLSMIWFSGRGETGALLEGEVISGLKDLSQVNAVIDRWLRPVGMTGFRDPLVEASKLIERVGKKNKHPFSLFFMSDGGDNCCSRADILKAVELATGGLASSTFVEYGFYADRNLLASMAERAGGTLIHADAFDKFEAVVEASLQKRAVGGKRVEVKVGGDPIGGFVYALADGEITTYEVSAGKATVGVDVANVYYLSPRGMGRTISNGDLRVPGAYNELYHSGLYAAMSLFAVRCKPEVVYPLLKLSGDVRFINSFSTCFGKQAYSTFMDAAKAAAFSPQLRLVDGYDPNLVPPDDAFTVLDLLRVLTDDEDARILLDHPSFQYSRISRGTVSADENLSANEAKTVEAIRLKMAGEKKALVLKKLQGEIDAILASKQAELVFAADPAPDGYPMLSLTYNSERPNVSVLVKKTGMVDLTPRLASSPADMDIAKFGNFRINTFVFRNYAIVRDGLVNVEKLPVKVSVETREKLAAAKVSMLPDGDSVLVIDLRLLPIMNRKMVEGSVSAAALIKLEYDLQVLKAAQKVLNTIRKEQFPEAKIAGWVSKYGEEGAKWLEEQGLTEYKGFSPRRVQSESVDFYVGKELVTKLKGLSSLPSVKEVREKMAKATAAKPLTGGAALMAPVITRVDEVLATFDPKAAEAQVIADNNRVTRLARQGMRRVSETMMGIVVGQRWFAEFKSLDENTLTVKVGGQDVTGTIVMSDVEVRI